jgi:hypothetical protein
MRSRLHVHSPPGRFFGHPPRCRSRGTPTSRLPRTRGGPGSRNTEDGPARSPTGSSTTLRSRTPHAGRAPVVSIRTRNREPLVSTLSTVTSGKPTRSAHIRAGSVSTRAVDLLASRTVRIAGPSPAHRDPHPTQIRSAPNLTRAPRDPLRCSPSICCPCDVTNWPYLRQWTPFGCYDILVTCRTSSKFLGKVGSKSRTASIWNYPTRTKRRSLICTEYWTTFDTSNGGAISRCPTKHTKANHYLQGLRREGV